MTVSKIAGFPRFRSLAIGVVACPVTVRMRLIFRQHLTRGQKMCSAAEALPEAASIREAGSGQAGAGG
jgi:hypothetical protein